MSPIWWQVARQHSEWGDFSMQTGATSYAAKYVHSLANAEPSIALLSREPIDVVCIALRDAAATLAGQLGVSVGEAKRLIARYFKEVRAARSVATEEHAASELETTRAAVKSADERVAAAERDMSSIQREATLSTSGPADNPTETDLELSSDVKKSLDLVKLCHQYE